MKMIDDVSYTLYKKDTKGKIRLLTLLSSNGFLIQESGIVGGKLTARRKECKPKNVGRANATTSQEQAVFEVVSKIKGKLREGYFNTIVEAQNTVVIMPMLAKVFAEESKKIDWDNAYAQPKFDGQRCLAFVKENGVVLMSRKNVEITTMPHIIEAIEGLNLPVGTILDGELYIHGHSFQENMRLIKKIRPESKNVVYHIYDVIQDECFVNRHLWIQANLELTRNITTLKTVVTHKLTGNEMLRALNSLWVEAGYEGSMVRWGMETYKVGGRSSHLLKNKAFQDISLIIKDIVPQDADPTMGQPTFQWEGATYRKMPDTMGSNPKGSVEYCRYMLKNKDEFIGRMAELRFFEFSDTGVPRFPIYHGLRNDK